MASDRARRLAQAMHNSLSALPGREGQVYGLRYRIAESGAFNPFQIGNVLDARPGLELLGDPRPGPDLEADVERLEDGFRAMVGLTRDLGSLAESIPVWVEVLGDGANGVYYLADFSGPMSREDAGVHWSEVVLPSAVEEALDPAESFLRSAQSTGEQMFSDPLGVVATRLKEAPGWVWAALAVGGAIAVGPTVLDLMRS